MTGLTPEQRERRQGGLGASEIPAVVGVDRYRNALDVWLEKVGQAEPFAGNEYTHFGNKLEPVIRQEYADRMGVEVSVPSETYEHPEHEWVLCTPDGIVLPVAGSRRGDETEEDRRLGWGVECKNRNFFNYRQWGPATDEVPVEVAAQCHWSMFVTGLRRWDAVVLLGGNRLAIYTVRYDQEMATLLYQQARTFWFDHVIAGVAPAIDGSDSASRYLERKWSLYGSDLKEPTADIVEHAQQLRDVKIEQKGLDGERSRLENLIKDFIGDQLGILLPDGSRITWKRPKASRKTDWETVARALWDTIMRDLKVDRSPETFETVVDLHTEERQASRRFLTQCKE